jgi:hypothetical protein
MASLPLIQESQPDQQKTNQLLNHPTSRRVYAHEPDSEPKHTHINYVILFKLQKSLICKKVTDEDCDPDAPCQIQLEISRTF